MHLTRSSYWTIGRALICVIAPLLCLAPAMADPPKPANAGAAAPEPSASHLAAARQLVIVSGMSRSFDAAVPHMISQLTSTMSQTRPEIMPDLAAVLKEITPDFDKDTDHMIDRAAHVYAKLLSEEQIKAAITFFTSDDGKKYVQAEPVFFNAVINEMQDWHQEIQDELMTKVRAEMKKRGKPL
ncbi:MAG: DUF2059 domain-containing protein [Methylovirgula sp.]